MKTGASGWKPFLELTKPRVTAMVILTAAAGFYLASPRFPDWFLLVHIMFGTALLAGGTAVLNQYMERKADARMQRTANRPLPSGRVEPRQALLYGMLLVSAGTLYLWAMTNLSAALIGWLTSVVYLLLYTPLKTRTTLCTFVGAFPGAMPTLIGWAAVRGTLDLQAFALFAILFVWQFPHFLAISWLYRDDYRRGGFTMLPMVDPQGRKTSRRIFACSLALLAFSLTPTLLGLTGVWYFSGALLLGLAFLGFSTRTAQSLTQLTAGRLLRVSVIYLPLLLILMAADKS